MKPLYLRQSFLTYYFQSWQPSMNVALYGGCFMYYDPEEPIEEVLKRIPSVFFPKLRRMKTQQQEKVRKVLEIILDCVVHPEKRMKLKQGVLDYESEESEKSAEEKSSGDEDEVELPVETEPDSKITQFYKSKEGEAKKEKGDKETGDSEKPKEEKKEEENESKKEENESKEEENESEKEESEEEPKITEFFHSMHSETSDDEDDDFTPSDSSHASDMLIESDESSAHSGNEKENEKEGENENENEDEDEKDKDSKHSNPEKETENGEHAHSHTHHSHHSHHSHEDEDEDDALLKSYLGKRRRTSSILESTVDSYLRWIDGPCGFPVLVDPFASASSMDFVDAPKLNYILRPELYSRPAKAFLRPAEFLPSLCVLVDAQIMQMPAILREQMKAFGADLVDAEVPMTPEEADLFDEIQDVFHWRFHSMHFCKTRRWKSQHNENTDATLAECFELFRNKGNNDASCPWYLLFLAHHAGSARSARRTSSRRASRTSGARRAI